MPAQPGLSLTSPAAPVRTLVRLGAAAVALVSVGGAAGSIYVGADAPKATLQVDAKGTAVVKFTSHGKADVVVVPATGPLFHGGW